MIAYITGTSSGIGKSLAEKLLADGHKIIGLSRQCKLKHKNYKHIYIDLSDIKQTSNFTFDKNTTNDVILINNAGSLGMIKPIGSLTNKSIISLNNLNIISPELLSNKFIKQFGLLKQNYQIINISSGAGKRPIDAWATYCASKAAIDLFSATIANELKERKKTNWHVFSIAPGVVDTQMQVSIRQAKPKDFLAHQKFVNLKNNNELISPKIVANQICNLIYSPNKAKTVIFNIKDLV